MKPYARYASRKELALAQLGLTLPCRPCCPLVVDPVAHYNLGPTPPTEKRHAATKTDVAGSAPAEADGLQAEVARRQAAEARVQELEARAIPGLQTNCTFRVEGVPLVLEAWNVRPVNS